MKHWCLVCILFLIAVLSASVTWSQEGKALGEIMDLKSKEFGKHHEHFVRFNHYLHETAIRCMVCHHDFNVFNNKNEGKGSKCSGCHKKQLTEDIPIPLLTAFHKKCIGCHENYIAYSRKSGPVMCSLCHK